MRAFGCPAYVHTNNEKSEPRSTKGIFIGYPSGVKGYKVWLPDHDLQKSMISRDVIFNEYEMLKDSRASPYLSSKDSIVEPNTSPTDLLNRVESVLTQEGPVQLSYTI